MSERAPRRSQFSIATVALLVVSGCKHAGGNGSPPATSPPPPTRPLVGQPCPLTPASEASNEDGNDLRVFFEVGTLRGEPGERARQSPAPLQSFTEWLNEPRSGAGGVAHLMGKNGSPTTVPLDHEAPPGAPCTNPERWDLTITPHITDARSSEVRLEVVIAPAPPLGTPPGAWYIPEHRLARTTVVARDQMPIVMALAPAVSSQVGPNSGGMIVITPYLLRGGDVDMRRLMACKMRNAAEGMRARSAAP